MLDSPVSFRLGSPPGAGSGDPLRWGPHLLTLLLLLAGCAAGAREEGPSPRGAGPGPLQRTAYDTLPDEPWVRHPDTPPLECEIHGYACSWGEVEPEEVDRAFEALLRAQEMRSGGRSFPEIADSLRGLPGMARVEVGEGVLRFNFEGTPLLTLADWSALAPAGLPSPGSVEPAPLPLPPPDPPRPPSGVPPPPPATPRGSSFDPVVGDNSDHGSRPFKRALALAPFNWELGTVETVQTVESLASTRDYGCEGCIEVRSTDFDPECDRFTDLDACRVEVATSWRDFTGWGDFDLIHILTHGEHICTGRLCLIALLTGNFLDPRSDGVGAVRGPLRRTPPGVEYVAVSQPAACERFQLTPGEPAWNSLCDSVRFWEIVTDDFFRWHYPRGLDDKIVVFAACNVFSSPTFVPHLMQGGNSSAVGWMDPVPYLWALDVNLDFYSRLTGSPALDRRGGGERARDAWVWAAGEVWPVGTGVRRVVDDAVEQWPRAAISLQEMKRGREMPFLMDRRTGREMAEGGLLELGPVTGDGRPGSIVLRVDVGGIGDDEDPADYPIRFKLDGEDLPGSYLPTLGLEEALHRFEGVVPLDREVRPGQRVELDVRVEAPGGGFSRWLYPDLLLLGACSFAGTLTEVRIPQPRERYLAAVGAYEGRATFDESGRLVLTIENQGRPDRDHGTPEVTEFTLTVNPRQTPAGPASGQLPLASAQLQLSRPNPFHDPRRTNRSTETLFTSFDYDPRQDDRAGPGGVRSGVLDLESMGTGAMLGRIRIPLSRRDASLTFEGVFNAGRAALCGG